MRLIFVWMMLCISTPLLAAESALLLASRADVSCLNITPVGVCRRNTPPFVGVKMRFWQPALLVETVKQPGQSGIVELLPFLAPFSNSREKGLGSGSRDDTTVLRADEAHVLGFPLTDAISTSLEAPCEGEPDFSGGISYLSEQDSKEWHEARMEQYHPLSVMTGRLGAVCDRFGPMLPGLCVGAWGPLHPRTGYVVHASEQAASALAAFRAVDIAALKPQTPHVVMSSVLFWPSVRFDRMQMVSPAAGRCMAAGENPVFWDHDNRSADGRYVWVYWRKKECCLF